MTSSSAPQAIIDKEASLDERIKKLAVDKAHLQLVVDMMNRLNQTAGLTGVLQCMMSAVLENIGGADVLVYYTVDHELFRASLLRNLEKIEVAADPMVEEVFASGEPIESQENSPDSIMRLPNARRAWSLAYPLKAGEDLIGVLKVECLHIDAHAMRSVLPPFFNFAAQILKNEILGHTRLQRAYDELTVANDELTRAKAELERQMRERNAAFEELTRRSTALEQANRELESFSYSMSHDLRPPLRAIDGFSRLVMEDYGDILGDEGRRCMSLVRQGANRLSRIIDDLLAFFQLYHAAPNLARVDMAALVACVAEELRSKEPPDRRIDVRLGDLPPALCDKALMRQALTCLIDNALKFTASRDIAVVEVGGAMEDGESRYWVKDNGAGFDPQFSHKLFGVFQRLHGVDEFGGTGIGLAIVKRIVERHRGRVWAEGRVGGGAAFHFALPAAGSAAAPPPESFMAGRHEENCASARSGNAASTVSPRRVQD